MANCTIVAVREVEYHNSVRKRPVWTVRMDDGGREHHIDASHVTSGARVGARATISYEETDWGCAYIVRPEPQDNTNPVPTPAAPALTAGMAPSGR